MAEAKVQALQTNLRRAYNDGQTRSYSFRVQQLQALKNSVQKHADLLKDAVFADHRRIQQLTNIYEIATVIRYIDYILEHLKQWMKPTDHDIDAVFSPGTTHVIQEPMGAVLILGSWNFPVSINLCKLITAMAAGNVVLLKPSEVAAKSAEAIATVMAELDQNYYKCITGGVETSIAVTKVHWDLIAFTGSSDKGKLIAKAAAEFMTPTILELGGKNPVIVDQQVNLVVACQRISQARHINSGQLCIAPEVALVFEPVVDKFIEAYKVVTEEFFGQDAQRSSDFSRIINQMHTRRIQDLIEEVKGYVVYGGRVDVDDQYVSPTIVLNPPKDSRIMKEEIFGPVLIVISVNGIQDAIDYINANEKPLAVYYYGDNAKNRDLVQNNTSSGNFSVYECAFHYCCPDIPFGGVGNSGMGRYFGRQGFVNFSNTKSILARGPAMNLQVRYPPYNDAKFQRFQTLQKYLGLPVSTLVRRLKYLTVGVALGAGYYFGYHQVILNSLGFKQFKQI